MLSIDLPAIKTVHFFSLLYCLLPFLINLVTCYLGLKVALFSYIITKINHFINDKLMFILMFQ